MVREIYQSGQVRVIFPWITDRCDLFVVGGPADGDEGQLFKTQFPALQVIGFEPCRDYYFGQRDLWEFPGKLHNTALWDKSELELPFIVMERSSRLLEKSNSLVYTYSVKTTTLADCEEVKTLAPDRTLALWIDVERAELEVLQGAVPLLEAGKIELVYFEAFSESLGAIEHLLNHYGLVERGQFNSSDVRSDSLFTLPPG